MSKAIEIANDEVKLNALESLMWKAGDAILDVYHQDDFETETKGDNSPVTKADLAAHNVLVSGLKTITPDIPVVSEEDANSLQIPSAHSVYWLIDPLDGTKEFIKRNGEFTCNLALIENNAATLGFVGVPAQDELYVGGCNTPSNLITRAGLKREIRSKHSDPGITRVVASKSHLNKETERFISDLKGEVELVQAGSSLKFLKIAVGEADIYPRLAPTCEWDTAAAQAVLEGAGGSVMQASGEAMRYGKDEILNPHFIAKGIE
jgi:3'(2'), 5'-bisphosphate nucleotidase